MAILTAPDRLAVAAAFTQLAGSRKEGIAVLKADLRAAINAADAWADANATAYNTAIPLPARTSLTAKQKAEILAFVIRRRWEVA